jgi:NADPH:quinone reductase-like Zn-dependent oxidoreductase
VDLEMQNPNICQIGSHHNQTRVHLFTKSTTCEQKEEVEPMTTKSELPETMKAAVVEAAGPPKAIHIKDVPVPRLSRHHVIIALEYAGLGSWDAAQRSGAWGPVKPGTILGADGSGTIAAVAADVTNFKPGDRVYSYSYANPSGGFHAEYVSVPADRVGHIPPKLDMKIAGAMPCVALTAQTGLEVLKVHKGQTLAVFGASGGVGSLAVWLGKERGATIVGSARPDAQDYVRSLGAAHAVDPNSSEHNAILKRFAPEGFDAAIVCANSGALADFLSHLKAGAPFAYPNGVEPKPHVSGHAALTFDGEMSRAAIDRLNSAIGSRTIPLRVQEFALKEVVEAHLRIEQGHVVGKIVLRIRS